MALVGALNFARTELFGIQPPLDPSARGVSGPDAADPLSKPAEAGTTRPANLAVSPRALPKAKEIDVEVRAALEADVRQQAATVKDLEVAEAVTGRLAELFGAADAPGSIAGKIDDLKAAWRGLAGDPSEPGRRSAVFSAAEDATELLRTLSSGVQAMRAEVDARIADAATRANRLIDSVGQLNQRILAARDDGNEAGGAIAERAKLLGELNEIVAVKSFERPDGQLSVLGPGARTMLGEARHRLTHVATDPFTPRTPGHPLTIETYGTLVDVSAEARASGGEIGGLLRLRDEILPRTQAQLDVLAGEVAGAVGTVAYGVTAERLDLIVDAGGEAPSGVRGGLAAEVEVRSAVSSDPSRLAPNGDPSIALGVVTQFEAKRPIADGVGAIATGLPSSETLSGFAARMLEFQANLHSDIGSQLNFQRTLHEAYGERVRSGEDADIDREMNRLHHTEDAFAGSTRVLKVVRFGLGELNGMLR